MEKGKDYLECEFCGTVYIPQFFHVCIHAIDPDKPHIMPKEWIAELGRYNDLKEKEKKIQTYFVIFLHTTEGIIRCVELDHYPSEDEIYTYIVNYQSHVHYATVEKRYRRIK